ncbi:unnamed protein product [Kluyveromyces dobzhanskii CBS 2104]|uniref:WGS project CCBQ000000000 data, contig 00106 n=1 Tax=Kluyveromyces dobzhanskii CBS 2104 TaxID=1427455 RepID=A0A0A8L7J8_9SACH|nr:unnamed protein product [Kluyveromyces dobzhanskii CBS 2104]
MPLTTELDMSLLDKLRTRDLIDQRFSQLFETVPLLPRDDIEVRGNNLQLENSIKNLKELLAKKESDKKKLLDILNVKNRDAERLNDELISSTIENNILQERLALLQKEYDTLIERWLRKAQIEADTMNSKLT